MLSIWSTNGQFHNLNSNQEGFFTWRHSNQRCTLHNRRRRNPSIWLNFTISWRSKRVIRRVSASNRQHPQARRCSGPRASYRPSGLLRRVLCAADERSERADAPRGEAADGAGQRGGASAAAAASASHRANLKRAAAARSYGGAWGGVKPSGLINQCCNKLLLSSNACTLSFAIYQQYHAVNITRCIHIARFRKKRRPTRHIPIQEKRPHEGPEPPAHPPLAPARRRLRPSLALRPCTGRRRSPVCAAPARRQRALSQAAAQLRAA